MKAGQVLLFIIWIRALRASGWKLTGLSDILATRDSAMGHTPIKGQTQLASAAKNGNAEVAKLLVENGSGVEIRDTDGRTPLFLAGWGGKEDIVKVLLDRGARGI